MRLKIICSGYIVRYPLGGMTLHHLQYLAGLERLGHEVIFLEGYGWPDSCYDPVADVMTSDPSCGLAYLSQTFERSGIQADWCYLAEDGTAYGMSRERLLKACRDCDLYINLSNVNWIPELEQCRRRVLIDTDPGLNQTGSFGSSPFSRYDRLFTYGENVHQPGCEMPTAGAHWRTTRQPVVLDLWPVGTPNRTAPFSTIMSWKSYEDVEHDGRIYGQKDRQFGPYFSMPNAIGESLELAVRPPAPAAERLMAGGWKLADPRQISRDPWTYQQYIRNSRAEFSLAAHLYTSTKCGWFSDRSAGYLASGRPVVVQDTHFKTWLPVGAGLFTFDGREDAIAGITEVNRRYEFHCRAARQLAEEYFDSRKVLSRLLEQAMGLDIQPAVSAKHGSQSAGANVLGIKSGDQEGTQKRTVVDSRRALQ